MWEAPELKLSILLRRKVLDKLKEVAQQVFSAPGEEAGGLLVGHAENLVETGERVITIENFESSMSGLHDPSLDGQVVGFARFRRQRTLHLKEPDFRALRAGLDQICLMIRPDGTGRAIGGFFFRQGKAIQYPTATMQFPIDETTADCHPVLREVIDDTEADSGTKRLLYAGIGLVLMLASLAIWLVGR